MEEEDQLNFKAVQSVTEGTLGGIHKGWREMGRTARYGQSCQMGCSPHEEKLAGQGLPMREREHQGLIPKAAESFMETVRK